MKSVRIGLLLAMTGAIALVSVSCGNAVKLLEGAERDTLLSQKLFLTSAWEPLVDYPQIGEIVWMVFKYPEENGRVVVACIPQVESNENSYTLLFINGQLALVAFPDSYNEDGFRVNRLFFYDEGKLIHVEETDSNNYETTVPVKPASADISRVSRIVKNIPSEITESVSCWQNEHMTYEAGRTLDGIDLTHLSDLRPLTGAAQLLRDSEFIEGLKRLCGDEWRYDTIWSWLAGNPSVQRFSDGSGFIVRSPAPLFVDGSTLEDVVLLVEYSTGGLFIGYKSSIEYEGRWLAQTRTPLSDVIVDALRPYMPVEDGYYYGDEDCCGDEYNDGGYYEGEYYDGDDYHGGPYGGDEYDYGYGGGS